MVYLMELVALWDYVSLLGKDSAAKVLPAIAKVQPSSQPAAAARLHLARKLRSLLILCS